MKKRFAPGVLTGVVLTLLLIAAGAYAGVRGGWMPANADSPPSHIETWAAKTSLRATVNREAPTQPNPVALSDENLIAGIKLYKQNCSVCHGASDGKPTNIARGLYQHAPQFAKHGVEDDPDGESYWKISHGIRLTGMPGFSKSLNDEQRWQLALFLKHMDALPQKANKVWHTMQ